jgi:hypothetical protein
MRSGNRILLLLTITILGFNLTHLNAKLTTSMLDSIILIHLDDLDEGSGNADQKQRRSALSQELLENQLNQSPAPELPSLLTSNFDATHQPPFETSDILTQALSDSFALDGPPSFDEFADSIENITTKKDGLNLSNKSFLSATKSLISAYLRAGGKIDPDANLPSTLFKHILPKIDSWGGGNVATWVKNISQISVEAYLDEDRSINELSSIASGFATSTVELLSNPSPLTDQLEINDLNLDYLSSSDDLSLEEKLSTGKNYAPSKTDIIQQLSVGISQGYFGYQDFNDESPGLSFEDFNTFTRADTSPSSLNDGNIPDNIITGFIDGLLDSAISLGESKEVFLYDSIKAAANGFLISSVVATTSNSEFLDQALYLDAAEMVAKQVSQSVILHTIEDVDGSKSYTMGTNWIEIDRVAESAASGSAMGSQLATVLPKSMEYSNSWEVATNIRREIAKSVSKGSASGSVNASAWLGSVIDPKSQNETVLNASDVERVSRGSSLGSMIGNTGLAIYYPTDQLVPIINLTAQGSAYGSTNAANLALVDPETIESVDIGVARQSALGSSMGAIFEPTVLLGLNPSQNSNDKKTIDHLTAASFGATFGAILGLQDNTEDIIGNNGASQSEEPRMIEVQQATKQGAIEGALAGAKLSLGLEEVSSNSLKSKAAMLKAINNANTKGASNSTSNVANQSLRTNPQDMLLLMKKFGINPRYTNPAKMYKRPVLVQIDEPPIDDDSSDAINNASPL